MTNSIDRRTFLTTTAVAAGAASLPATHAKAMRPAQRPAAGPIAIASANGMKVVEKAYQDMVEGADPLDAVVAGVNIVELDERDMSVGYGGLPNERGVVQLDASVMHGPTHKAGAVAAIENIATPASVALKVCRHTDHVLIVGEGALEFARAWGFEERNLLTDRARRVWLKWKRNLSPNDDWLDDDQTVGQDPDLQTLRDVLRFTYGTINCSGLDAHGNLGGVTTTSGLSFKIPGRVGDSPLVGAGMFVDNEVGAAGSTGRGESVIQSCGAFQAVHYMSQGDDPDTACLKVLEWIARHTKREDLLNDAGKPRFGVKFYAITKDGRFGGASMQRGGQVAVCDANGARKVKIPSLLD